MIYLKTALYVVTYALAIAAIVALSGFLDPEDTGTEDRDALRIKVTADGVRFTLDTPDGKVEWERPLTREK